MENKMVLDILKECGCVLDGHFLFSSGLHSNRYCQCALLLQHPDKSAKVLSLVADQVKDLGAELLVGPAMGGIIVAYELGRQLGLPAIFTERENNIMKLRRNFDFKPGTKILITEDAVTTGKSSFEAIEALKGKGAEILGICCVADRRMPGTQIGLPLYAATSIDSLTYHPEDCPICKEGLLPLVKPGSREMKQNS